MSSFCVQPFMLLCFWKWSERRRRGSWHEARRVLSDQAIVSRIMIRCRATRTSVTTSRFFVAVVLLSWMLALVCFFVFCFVFPYFFYGCLVGWVCFSYFFVWCFYYYCFYCLIIITSLVFVILSFISSSNVCILFFCSPLSPPHPLLCFPSLPSPLPRFIFFLSNVVTQVVT